MITLLAAFKTRGLLVTVPNFGVSSLSPHSYGISALSDTVLTNSMDQPMKFQLNNKFPPVGSVFLMVQNCLASL